MNLNISFSQNVWLIEKVFFKFHVLVKPFETYLIVKNVFTNKFSYINKIY